MPHSRPSAKAVMNLARHPADPSFFAAAARISSVAAS
jgi:hypothetical protein